MPTYRILLFLLTCCSLTVTAQDAGVDFVDIVHLYQGEPKTGTVITYQYGKRVVLVAENGKTYDFKWDEVKRVNFRPTENQRQRPPAVAPPPVPGPAIPPPGRRFWHQLDAGVSMGLSSSNRFDIVNTTIGGGASYHYVRAFGKLRAGLGVDVSLMSYPRRENVLAGTGLVEWQPGRGLKRVMPFVRFQGGVTYPFGASGSEEEVTARRLSPLYHPSVGLSFGPPKDGWGNLMIDFGYRFLNSRFDLTTATLDVVERRVVYRRLVLRGGYRF